MRVVSGLLLLAAGLLPGAAAQGPAPVPVIFVHGNGDDASKWIPTIWMFESNGYPADRLFSLRLTDPVARRNDREPEPFRSSTADQAAELSAMVTRVLLATKAPKVALVGSSRGGLTIRNYLKNAGGAAVVSHAVLCGTPNHGVMALDTNLDGEFNAKGHFLRQLNEGSEVLPAVRFLTLRSDKLDKFAQANVGFDAPALAGAENVVLAGLDHREVAFHPAAFAAMYRFLTGREPRESRPVAEQAPVVSGVITGFAGLAPTNRPVAGVHVAIYALEPGTARRAGGPVLEATTGETGAWGPLSVEPRRGYEVVLARDGRTVTYFLSGLLRSTGLLNFRLLPAEALAALGGAAPAGPRLLIHRPQGYLSQGRDPVAVDGTVVPALLPGVPTRDSVAVAVPSAGPEGVRVELRGEVIHARPATRPDELNVAELIWD